MSKKKRNKKSESVSLPKLSFNLNPKVKNFIWGVFLLFLGFLFLLSFFDLSGPLGGFFSAVFDDFFGIGKWLVPLAFWGFAFSLLRRREEENFYLGTGWGLVLILISFLGLGDLLSPEVTGSFGRFFGGLEKLIGLVPALIAYFSLSAIGLAVDFWELLVSFWNNRFKPVEVKERVLPLKKEVDLSAKKEVQEDESLELPSKSKSLEKELFVNLPFLKDRKVKKAFVDASGWEFPPLDLLESDGGKPTAGDINLQSRIIQRSLADFGIDVEMGEIHTGPTVTQYTLKPAQGVKLARIVALQNDLALALAAHPIRIEAPIPGKSLVGIEVPNRSPSTVRLRTLIEDQGYTSSANPLLFPLGRDVMGNAVFSDISRLPHLLVAGATGTGKSIFIHSVISSLIYRNPPQNLRFILIDPKRVELSAYDGIPYLLCPVITEGKKSIMAMKWAITEMERRYELLLEEKSRDIHSYNQKMGEKSKEKSLPYIVVFIDELADLMATYGKELETMIIRLSQMARATGIHLVVSTQRPSVEVITGLIKANITARVAFQVASQIDSRTILDTAGAEKLLGRGDSLFISADTSKPKRIQGPFISEKEAEKIVDFLKQKGLEKLGEDYGFDSDLSGMLLDENLNSDEVTFDVGDDSLYQEAYNLVVKQGKASTTMLQRYLKIGYARAARLMDLLERHGVIGQAQGARQREVLISETAFPDESLDTLKPVENLTEEVDEIMDSLHDENGGDENGNQN